MYNFIEQDTTKKYKTIHPLSSLPYNVPYDILLNKYCRLLELYHSIKTEIKILKEENKQYKDNKLDERNIDIKGNNNINIININSNIIDKIQQEPIIIKGTIIPIENIQNKSAIFELNKTINYLSYNIKKNIPKNIKRIEPKFNSNIKPKNDKTGSIENNKTGSIENDKSGSIKIPKRKQNIIKYYEDKRIIERIRALIKENIGDQKICNILNREEYKSFEGNEITRYVVRRLRRYC
jgi:hypothetical protein